MILRENPATGEPVVHLAAGSARDIDAAVAVARQSFCDGRWSAAAPSLRKDVLARFADGIKAEAAGLDRLDAEEMGKPISTVMGNAAGAARLLRFHADAVDRLNGEVFTTDGPNFAAQRWVPRGVVGAITPWNFPTSNAIRKIAPALAAGNSVVLKPSELATRSAMRLAELAIEVGLPAGVLNVVPGLGETVGRALACHDDIDMVTFTGSTDVGKRIMQLAGGSNLKVVLAECGGKSPQILCDDGIDIEAASNAVADFLVTNQGQICSLGSRLIVARSIQAEVVERIAARVATVRIGNPLDPATSFGPLASKAQLERVMRHVESARSAGAVCVTGGTRPPEHGGGQFFLPTIFQDVDPASALAQEEIFGPVLSVMPFDDIDHAIRLANATRFGLTAYVWTRRIDTGMQIARALRSSAWINAVPPRGEGPGHAAPIEPSGLSGVGVEGGVAGIEAYSRRQSLFISHG